MYRRHPAMGNGSSEISRISLGSVHGNMKAGTYKGRYGLQLFQMRFLTEENVLVRFSRNMNTI